MALTHPSAPVFAAGLGRVRSLGPHPLRIRCGSVWPFRAAPPILAVLLAALPQAGAQITSLSSGLNPVLARVLQSTPAFSALADVRVLNTEEAGSMRMPMEFKFLDGAIRTEINMAQVQSPVLRQEMVVKLREIGMDQVVTIGRPGQGPMLVLYPHVQASIEIPNPGDPAATASGGKEPAPQTPAAAAPASKPLRKTPLDKEVVDGHPCQKFKVLIESTAGGKPQEVLVWEAQDLKGFPLQIEMAQPGLKMVVLFRDIHFERPDPKDFQAPPGFTKFESMEKVMEKAVNRLLGDPAPKKNSR